MTRACPRRVHDILMQFDVLFNVSDDGSNLFGAPLVRVDSSRLVHELGALV